MASADFSLSNAWSGRSPQVRADSFLQSLLDLLQNDITLLDVTMMCLLVLILQPLIQFLFVSTGFCSLASFNVYLAVNHLATY